MDVQRESRRSDSPFVERVSRLTSIGDVRAVTTPDGTWDFVFRNRLGRVEVLQTGQIVQPIELDYEPGDSYFAIAFKPDVYMPQRPGSMMVNQGLLRPLAGQGAFWLDNDRLEIPTFDNAEQFVAQLARRGLIARDRLVAHAVEGSLKRLGDRTLQRHFAQVTGMSGKALQQILRANRAAALIEDGSSIAAVVAELGYSDQSHLTNSLRRFLGRTPGEIRADLGILKPGARGVPRQSPSAILPGTPPLGVRREEHEPGFPTPHPARPAGTPMAHEPPSQPQSDPIEELIDFLTPAVTSILRRLEADEFTTIDFIDVLKTDPTANAAFEEAVRLWGEQDRYSRMVVHGQVIPLILRRSGLVDWVGYAHGQADDYAVPAWWRLRTGAE